MRITSDERKPARPSGGEREAAGFSEVQPGFREMIDLLPAAVYTTDAGGRITHFNPACVELSGRTPELGTDSWCVTLRLYHPDGTPMPHDECPMAIALKEGRALRGERAIAERPDGTRVWFEAYPTPLRDAEGRVVGGINMLVDITKRRRAEDLLAGGKSVLERLATGGTLEQVLTVLVRLIEAHTEGLFGSILVRHRDGTRFSTGVAPSLPGEYVEALVDRTITPPYMLPCGRAAYLGEEVVVAEIEADGRWSQEWRGLVRDLGLRTCYSAPIRGSKGQPLGSFGMYFAASRDPRPAEPHLIETATYLAGVAIEHEQTEAALRAKQSELVDFFENATVGLHLVGADGTILRANQAELDLLGFERDEYVGRNISEFHADQHVIEDILRRLRAGETLKRYEARLRCKNGSIRHVLIDSSVLFEEDRFIHTRCFTRDITEQKQAELDRMRLLEDERAARKEAEALNDVARAVSGLDLESVVQKATDAATELTGAEFGAFFYNVMDETGEAYLLYTLSGAPREAFEKLGLPRNTAVFGPTFRGDGIVRVADITADPRYGKNPPYHGMPPGHLPVRSYLAVPVVASSGEVLGGLFFGHSETDVFSARAERVAAGIAVHTAIAIDNARLYGEAQQEIAQRKRIEESLRESESRLREADQRKDEFLATLAHELRNPLAPISSSMEIMRRSGVDGDATERARQIMARQVTHLVRLVDDLLDVSRISRDKFELRRERVSLDAIIRSAIEASRPLFDAHAQELVISIPARTLWLDADPTRAAQILTNLLNNAAKYSPEGVRVELIAEQQGHEAVVRVRDPGVGISKEMLPHVFEMFRQGDSPEERARGGLGIGLTLVKSLVEMHGGTVEAHSEGPGRGSEFVVRLPIIEEKSTPSSGPSLAEPLATSPRRILVVDDNIDSADSLAVLLTQVGHHTRTAHDGPEALEAAAAFRPDVVLLDIGLPGLSGHEVAQRIREQPWGKDILLVALTGWGREEDRSRSREAGFDHHFVKPVDHAVLSRILAAAGSAKGS